VGKTSWVAVDVAEKGVGVAVDGGEVAVRLGGAVSVGDALGAGVAVGVAIGVTVELAVGVSVPTGVGVALDPLMRLI